MYTPLFYVGVTSQLKLRKRAGREQTMSVLSDMVTSVIRDERVEYTFSAVSEARNYVERLIAEAVRHGDKHQPTMELADFWIKDKRAVHKLFKVTLDLTRKKSLCSVVYHISLFCFRNIIKDLIAISDVMICDRHLLARVVLASHIALYFVPCYRLDYFYLYTLSGRICKVVASYTEG